ncbi:hypothetical protein FNO01nite_29490 [Flavobacterium noncentrifugens]|uniref:Uncharacterized protein n=1 Tax=Flavobacterium noncentrifugens TaxID=1128970 RepID=A0A1G8Y1P4_9FLAO|nr:hypothetical protein [Flavobacterium noncentrifugens]GEP52277.1 hypothetical protein FNO01nite_29490 [Flavobacterium noncentrifugens]SDJ96759.1 hypothetical protein SAMN04487935_2157 [Flavobacterium noncentrifugens]
MQFITIKDLKLELANNYNELGQIRITHVDGKPEFIGYRESMNEDTLDFVMMSMAVEYEKDRYQTLDFNNVDIISIQYQRSNDNLKKFKVIHKPNSDSL